MDIDDGELLHSITSWDGYYVHGHARVCWCIQKLLQTELKNGKCGNNDSAGKPHGTGGKQHCKGGKQHGKGGKQHGKGGKQQGKGGKQHGKGGKQHGKGGTHHGKNGLQHGNGGTQHGNDGKQHVSGGKGHVTMDTQGDKPPDKKGTHGTEGGVYLPRRVHHPTLNDVWAVYATSKSYCLYKLTPESTKKTLLVEVSGNKVDNHAVLLRDVMIASCRRDLSKDETVALRDSWMP